MNYLTQLTMSLIIVLITKENEIEKIKLNNIKLLHDLYPFCTLLVETLNGIPIFIC